MAHTSSVVDYVNDSEDYLFKSIKKYAIDAAAELDTAKERDSDAYEELRQMFIKFSEGYQNSIGTRLEELFPNHFD